MKTSITIRRLLFKVLRFGLQTLLSVIILLAGYLLSAYCLSYFGTTPKEPVCQKNRSLYLSNNGVHIDIILPVSSIDIDFLNQLGVNNSSKYLALGWGDRGFYLNTPSWDDLDYGTTAKALFWWSPSVMHVSTYQGISSNWLKLNVCDQQIAAICKKAAASFKQDKTGQFLKIPDAAYGRNDAFYEAKGSYHLFQTCNVWTGQALKKASIKTAIWSPFTYGIIRHARQQAALD